MASPATDVTRRHSVASERGFIASLRELASEASADDVTGLAAEMSYRFLLALFPLFIFFAALAAFATEAFGVANPTQQIMDQIGTALPDDARSTIESQLEPLLSSQRGGLLSFGIIAALWAGSGATKAVMKGMNRAYDVQEERGFVRKNLVAVGLTLIFSVATIAGFALLVAGQFFGKNIAEAFGLGSEFGTAVSLARWPIVLFLLVVASAFVYWSAPNAHLRFRWVSWGALVFVIGWLVVTALFGLYVANFSNYSDTYGALGGVVILLVWFYLTSILLLLGAEVNALLRARQTGETRGRSVTEDIAHARSMTASGARGRPASAPARPVDRQAGALGLAVTAIAGWRALTAWRRDEARRDHSM